MIDHNLAYLAEIDSELRSWNGW